MAAVPAFIAMTERPDIIGYNFDPWQYQLYVPTFKGDRQAWTTRFAEILDAQGRNVGALLVPANP